MPTKWDERRKLWERAFSEVGVLQLHAERDVALMKCIVDSARDRNFAAHVIWGEFVAGAPEPTMYATILQPRKGTLEDFAVCGTQRPRTSSRSLSAAAT
jgi:hypothetical protein